MHTCVAASAVCVCVCVCVRARVYVCVCVCVRALLHQPLANDIDARVAVFRMLFYHCLLSLAVIECTAMILLTVPDGTKWSQPSYPCEGY